MVYMDIWRVLLGGLALRSPLCCRRLLLVAVSVAVGCVHGDLEKRACMALDPWLTLAA